MTTVPTTPAVSETSGEQVWEKRDAYRIYSRWVKAGDKSNKSVWAAIQEAHTAGAHPDQAATAPTDAVEPKGYAVTAAELRRIADALDTLPGAPSHVSIDIQTEPVNGTDEEIAAAVDAVAMAILGIPGKDRDLSGGGSQRHAGHWTNQGGTQSFGVHIYQMYVRTDPKDAEIELLRAELALAKTAGEPTRVWTSEAADPTGLKFSREAEDPEPGVVADGIEGGSVTGRSVGGFEVE